jgi:hypothetical protein
VDFVVHNEDGGGAIVTAVSDRAVAYLEERVGKGVAQFRCDEGLEDTFLKLPQDWVIGEADNVSYLK